LKGLFKGFQWLIKSLKSVKYFWSYDLNEVCNRKTEKEKTNSSYNQGGGGMKGQENSEQATNKGKEQVFSIVKRVYS